MERNKILKCKTLDEVIGLMNFSELETYKSLSEYKFSDSEEKWMFDYFNELSITHIISLIKNETIRNVYLKNKLKKMKIMDIYRIKYD